MVTSCMKLENSFVNEVPRVSVSVSTELKRFIKSSRVLVSMRDKENIAHGFTARPAARHDGK